MRVWPNVCCLTMQEVLTSGDPGCRSLSPVTVIPLPSLPFLDLWVHQCSGLDSTAGWLFSLQDLWCIGHVPRPAPASALDLLTFSSLDHPLSVLRVEASLPLKLFLPNRSMDSFPEAPPVAQGRGSAIRNCLQRLMKAEPRPGQPLDGPDQMKLGNTGRDRYSRWCKSEGWGKISWSEWVTQRCGHRKVSPKADSNLGAVVFAVIPLAEKLHGQAQGQGGRKYPRAWTQRSVNIGRHQWNNLPAEQSEFRSGSTVSDTRSQD